MYWKKKNSPEIEQRLLLSWTRVFDHRSEEQTLFQSYFNPLSPNSDQHQFSPNNIHTLSRNKVMRINEMITKEKMPRSFIRVSQLIRKGNVWGSVWRICMWILGLKGLKLYVILKIFLTPTFFSTKFWSKYSTYLTICIPT